MYRKLARPVVSFTMHPIAMAVAATFAAVSVESALALPTGAQVTQGSVAVSRPAAANMTITQSSPRAIVNWQSFSIAAPETVSILQHSASSVLLNRVVGNSASEIFGRLTANGQVVLINQYGVLFGPNSQVDVGSLVASTLNVTDRNFLDGNYVFANGGRAGAVVNQGALRARNGGSIALIAPAVTNAGTIDAPGGGVALAAGDRVNLSLGGSGRIGVVIDQGALNATLDNSGRIGADGGTVVLSAQDTSNLLRNVVNMDGVIEARNVVQSDGKILITGGTSGIVSVSGTLDASGKNAGLTGGAIEVLGDKVGLFGSAKIDASGDAGGGTALVGGNFHGAGPEQNAGMSTVTGKVSINADAITRGDGGKVAIWSDDVTKFLGAVSARGGARGGDGGLVEVSGKQVLDFRGQVDTRAPNGATGLLLLDPDALTLQNTLATDGTVTNAAGAFTASANSSIRWSDIDTLLGTTSVSVTTGAGDITVSETGTLANGTGNTLSLNSSAALNLNAGITSASANGYSFTAPSGIRLNANLTTGGGNIVFNSPVTLGADAAVSAGAGNVNFANTVNGAQTLTVNSSGTTTFGGAVGGATPLRGLTTDAGGTTAINGGVVTIANTLVAFPTWFNSIAFNDSVTLGAATTLSGDRSIEFAGSVNGAQPLTVNASVVFFFNAVGGATPLASLTSNAVTGINGGTVTTTGAQTYNDRVYVRGIVPIIGTLGPQPPSIAPIDATTITGAGITFAGTVEGPQILTVNDSGTTTFGGTVGRTVDPICIGVCPAIVNPSPLTSLTTDAGGTTVINGGAVTSGGAQTYNDAVTLGAATTVTGTGITFASTVNGAQSLTVIDHGTTTFGGAVGGATALTSLTTTSNATAIGGGAVTTTATQTYNSPLTLTSPQTTLKSTGGNIALGTTALPSQTSPNSLSVEALQGTITLAGSVNQPTAQVLVDRSLLANDVLLQANQIVSGLTATQQIRAKDVVVNATTIGTSSAPLAIDAANFYVNVPGSTVFLRDSDVKANLFSTTDFTFLGFSGASQVLNEILRRVSYVGSSAVTNAIANSLAVISRSSQELLNSMSGSDTRLSVIQDGSVRNLTPREFRDSGMMSVDTDTK